MVYKQKNTINRLNMWLFWDISVFKKPKHQAIPHKTLGQPTAPIRVAQHPCHPRSKNTTSQNPHINKTTH